MPNTTDINKLTIKLCELKLEQRRVGVDINKMVNANKTIDFARARQLNMAKNGVAKKIENIESMISPNIIA